MGKISSSLVILMDSPMYIIAYLSLQGGDTMVHVGYEVTQRRYITASV
jgi:hypothetical protein